MDQESPAHWEGRPTHWSWEPPSKRKTATCPSGCAGAVALGALAVALSVAVEEGVPVVTGTVAVFVAQAAKMSRQATAVRLTFRPPPPVRRALSHPGLAPPIGDDDSETSRPRRHGRPVLPVASRRSPRRSS